MRAWHASARKYNCMHAYMRVWLVSGFWHGANWTFIFWGALNAVYFLPLLLLDKNRSNMGVAAEGRFLPNLRELWGISTTFILTVLAWIFFRAESLTKAFAYIEEIFSKSFFQMPAISANKGELISLALVAFFMLIEWLGREKKYAIEKLGFSWPKPLRWSFYALLIFTLGMYMQTNETPFIYFQF